MSEYEANARRTAQTIGITVRAAFKGDRCPSWDDDRHIHGDRYRVTIRRGRRSVSFDFWNSKHDQELGIAPGYYNVLSSIGSDVNAPTDPDEVAAEYGDMRPSQAVAVARFAKRLQAFFTEAEREQLSEIQ